MRATVCIISNGGKASEDAAASRRRKGGRTGGTASRRYGLSEQTARRRRVQPPKRPKRTSRPCANPLAFLPPMRSNSSSSSSFRARPFHRSSPPGIVRSTATPERQGEVGQVDEASMAQLGKIKIK